MFKRMFHNTYVIKSIDSIKILKLVMDYLKAPVLKLFRSYIQNVKLHKDSFGWYVPLEGGRGPLFGFALFDPEAVKTRKTTTKLLKFTCPARTRIVKR